MFFFELQKINSYNSMNNFSLSVECACFPMLRKILDIRTAAFEYKEIHALIMLQLKKSKHHKIRLYIYIYVCIILQLILIDQSRMKYLIIMITVGSRPVCRT